MESATEWLGLTELAQQTRLLTNADWALNVDLFDPAGRSLVLEPIEYLVERPLAFVREHQFSDPERHVPSITLRLSLCWDGFADAIELLARAATASQRFGGPEGIERVDLGDVGLSVRDDNTEAFDYLGFVRNNVLVEVGGPPHDEAISVANEVDRSLTEAGTTDSYPGERRRIVAESMARVDIDVRGQDGLFFVADHGAVNLDPTSPDRWYYRAPFTEQELIATVTAISSQDDSLVPDRLDLTIVVNRSAD